MRLSLARARTRAGVAALMLVLGCAAPPEPARPRDLVLLVVDTLRADRVGWYGGPNAVTPSLDGLVDERGVVFWNAFAQAPSTAPSVASLFTSRLPSQHGVRHGVGGLRPVEVTLAEALAEAGWVTGGFSANGVVRRRKGFAQGFRRYECELPAPFTKRRAADLNRAALDWLDEVLADPNRPRFFLYVQYLEPHVPYTVEPPALERLLDRRQRSPAGRSRVQALHDPRQSRAAYGLGGQGRLAVLDRIALADLYDAEVLSADGGVAAMLAGLALRGVLDEAVVVITADHGEELFEHGRMGHGTSLYHEVVHVPLAVLMPGLDARVDVREIVSLVDVAPTLLELVGVPVPGAFVGRSFRSLLTPGGRDGGGPERSAFVEIDRDGVSHRRAAIVRGGKLIEERDGTRTFLEIDQSGGERAVDEPDPRLEQVLAEGRGREETRPLVEPSEHLTPEERQRLHALGYLEDAPAAR